MIESEVIFFHFRRISQIDFHEGLRKYGETFLLSTIAIQSVNQAAYWCVFILFWYYMIWLADL